MRGNVCIMDIKELNVNQKRRTNRNHPWEHARAKVVCHLLKNKFPTAIQVIDVGCGDVFFLNQFCGKFEVSRAVAVDTAFTEDVVSQLKQNNENISFVNHIDQVDLQGEKADVVFLMDVIEHIEDDVDFLKTLSRKEFISDKTLLMITVPAFNRLYCSHDKWLGHYRRYDLPMLQKHLNEAGFQIERGGYFFTSLLFPRFIQKLIEKAKSKDSDVSGVGGWDKGICISTIYQWCLLIDFYSFNTLKYLGINMPGLSTYAICKRQL